jgi:UDP-N-acetylmuramate dehydrogenase
MFVLGGGSNLVIADEGFNGLVLRIALEGRSFESRGEETIVRAAAGESWDAVVEATVARQLAGLECLSGIPAASVARRSRTSAHTARRLATASRASMHSIGRPRRWWRSRAPSAASRIERRFKRDEPDRFVICAVTFNLRRGAPSMTYPDVVRALGASGSHAPDGW